MLLTGEGKKKTEQLVELQNSHIPCIAIDIPLEGEKCTYVESDNYAGAREAMQHLIGLGHRCIAFIGGDEISKTSYDRLRGYQDVLMESGIGIDPSLIQLGYFSREKARETAQRLMSLRPEITAFFAVSDEMAMGVIDGLTRMGYRVPQDVSVVGFDDIKEAKYAQPPLTTVRQDKYGLGSQAARTLLQIIEHPDKPIAPVTLPCNLIIRESTAVPRN